MTDKLVWMANGDIYQSMKHRKYIDMPRKWSGHFSTREKYLGIDNVTRNWFCSWYYIYIDRHETIQSDLTYDI